MEINAENLASVVLSPQSKPEYDDNENSSNNDNITPTAVKGFWDIEENRRYTSKDYQIGSKKLKLGCICVLILVTAGIISLSHFPWPFYIQKIYINIVSIIIASLIRIFYVFKLTKMLDNNIFINDNNNKQNKNLHNFADSEYFYCYKSCFYIFIVCVAPAIADFWENFYFGTFVIMFFVPFRFYGGVGQYFSHVNPHVPPFVEDECYVSSIMKSNYNSFSVNNNNNNNNNINRERWQYESLMLFLYNLKIFEFYKVFNLIYNNKIRHKNIDVNEMNIDDIYNQVFDAEYKEFQREIYKTFIESTQPKNSNDGETLTKYNIIDYFYDKSPYYIIARSQNVELETRQSKMTRFGCKLTVFQALMIIHLIIQYLSILVGYAFFPIFATISMMCVLIMILNLNKIYHIIYFRNNVFNYYFVHHKLNRYMFESSRKFSILNTPEQDNFLLYARFCIDGKNWMNKVFYDNNVLINNVKLYMKTPGDDMLKLKEIAMNEFDILNMYTFDDLSLTVNELQDYD